MKPMREIGGELEVYKGFYRCRSLKKDLIISEQMAILKQPFHSYNRPFKVMSQIKIKLYNSPNLHPNDLHHKLSQFVHAYRRQEGMPNKGSQLAAERTMVAGASKILQGRVNKRNCRQKTRS